MTDKTFRKFKLVDKDGYFKASSLNQGVYEIFAEVSGGVLVLQGLIGNGYLVDDSPSQDYLITPEEFKFFEEVVDDTKDNASSEWDAYPLVGTVCSICPPCSRNRTEFDCKILGYQKDSCDDNVVWIEKLNCHPHEEPFKTYPLNKVTFSKIQPNSWQEVLCEEFDIEYDSDNDVLNFLRGYSESGAIKLAKRIIELSEGN